MNIYVPIERREAGKLKVSNFRFRRNCTGLFKKKYTLSKIYFTKTTDAKSMSCVQMEGKSLKVLI
jgi:hypothetical protein